MNWGSIFPQNKKQNISNGFWHLCCLVNLSSRMWQNGPISNLFKEGLITPEAILQAGWDKLVEVLDRGHYVRYDFSTATKLLDVSKMLKEKYGTLTELMKQSQSIDELSSRLQAFKGIGPKTTEIFLRDIAPIFSKELRC